MLHLVVSSPRVGNCASAIPWTHWPTVGDTSPSKKAREAVVLVAVAAFVVVLVAVEVAVDVAPAPVPELAGPCL